MFANKGNACLPGRSSFTTLTNLANYLIAPVSTPRDSVYNLFIFGKMERSMEHRAKKDKRVRGSGSHITDHEHCS